MLYFIFFAAETYGSEITVVRTINGNTGASQYKIKNDRNRVIGATRQDLLRLTMCMNIQVENPVLILNQDAARSFLKECDAKKLYIFFMKATQIEAIIDKLNSTLKIGITLRNNLETMDKRILQEENEIQELSAKLSRLQSVQLLRQQIAANMNEIEWLHVITHEKQLLKSQQDLAKTRVEVKHIEDSLNNQAQHEKELKERICESGATFELLSKEIDKKNAKYEKARDEHEAELSKYREGENALKELGKRINKTSKDLKDIENDIAEYENNPDGTANLRRENEGKIAALENQRKEAVLILENAQRDQRMFIDNLNVSKDRLTEIKSRVQREDAQLQKLNNQIENYKRAGKDRMMAYGPSMSALLNEIEQLNRQRKFSAMPRGPIGRYVEVTDRKYRIAVENILDRTLMAFIVNSDQDRIVLKRTMSKYGDLRNNSIICCKFQDQVYDVSQGITDARGAGVVLFDVIKVSDPIVMNCLIDQKSIERIVLVDKTDEAIRLTQVILNNFLSCLRFILNIFNLQEERNVPENLMKVVLLDPFSEYYPAPNYRTYSLRMQPARFIQSNVEELIEGVEQEKRRVLEKLKIFKIDTAKAQTQMMEHEKLVMDKKRVAKNIEQRINGIEHELEELRAIEYPEESNIEFKRQLLEEEQGKLEKGKKKYNDMSNKINVLKEIALNFKKKVDEAQMEHEKTRENMSKVKAGIEKAQLELNDMKSNENTRKNQLNVCKALEVQNSAAVAKLTAEVQTLMQNASGARVECKREEAEIKSQNKSIEKKIERIESSHEDIDEIAKRLQDKTKSQTDQKSLIEGLKQIQKTLAKMRDCRFQYVRKLRQSMIMRVRHKFTGLMELKEFTGHMEVDMKEKTLELKVIPRDAGIEGAVSNTKSLSGGERSFSTVAFLIALWSCVDHPFYFLDEYDVFSDEYNRHIMTQLLFNEAKKNPSKQYGFLTPLDSSNMETSDRITIHKLQDPDRME